MSCSAARQMWVGRHTEFLGLLRPNPTQLNSTQLNTTQLNPTHLNSTQLNQQPATNTPRDVVHTLFVRTPRCRPHRLMGQPRDVVHTLFVRTPRCRPRRLLGEGENTALKPKKGPAQVRGGKCVIGGRISGVARMQSISCERCI